MLEKLRLLYDTVEELEYEYFMCKNCNYDGWVLYKGSRRVGKDTYSSIHVVMSDRVIVTNYDGGKHYIIDDNGSIIIPPERLQTILFAKKNYFIIRGNKYYRLLRNYKLVNTFSVYHKTVKFKGNFKFCAVQKKDNGKWYLADARTGRIEEDRKFKAQQKYIIELWSFVVG